MDYVSLYIMLIRKTPLHIFWWRYSAITHKVPRSALWHIATYIWNSTLNRPKLSVCNRKSSSKIPECSPTVHFGWCIFKTGKFWCSFALADMTCGCCRGCKWAKTGMNPLSSRQLWPFLPCYFKSHIQNPKLEITSLAYNVVLWSCFTPIVTQCTLRTALSRWYHTG